MHGFRTWDQLLHLEVHKWAGTLARLQYSNPCRMTSLVFSHKDCKWIHSCIAQYNHGRQLHGRILRTWRWEQPLFSFFGLYWQTRAQDREAWSVDAPNFLSWRIRNR